MGRTQLAGIHQQPARGSFWTGGLCCERPAAWLFRHVQSHLPPWLPLYCWSGHSRRLGGRDFFGMVRCSRFGNSPDIYPTPLPLQRQSHAVTGEFCKVRQPGQQKEPSDPLPRRAFKVASADFFAHAGHTYLALAHQLPSPAGWRSHGCPPPPPARPSAPSLHGSVGLAYPPLSVLTAAHHTTAVTSASFSITGELRRFHRCRTTPNPYCHPSWPAPHVMRMPPKWLRTLAQLPTSPGMTGNHIHLNGETGPCSTLYVKASTKRPN